MRRFLATFVAAVMLCCMIGEHTELQAEAATTPSETFVPYSGSLSYAGELAGVKPDLPELLPFAEEELDAKYDKATKGVSYRDFGYTTTDLKYMAAIIYCEANSMTYEAMAAVGNVVLNRLNDTKGWPHVNTVQEVIYDTKWGLQFTPTKADKKGVSYMSKALTLLHSMDSTQYKEWQLTAMSECVKVAKDVLCGVKVIPDSYQYFNAHVDTTITRCLNNGWSFVVYDEHIYYCREGE